MKSIKIYLPFLPPSVNQCYYTDWRTKTRHKSKDYREFVDGCFIAFGLDKFEGEIQVEYNFYFPDKRRRDIENYTKALSDTLVHYGVIEDDSKIMRMVLEKHYQKNQPETWIEIKSVMKS